MSEGIYGKSAPAQAQGKARPGQPQGQSGASGKSKVGNAQAKGKAVLPDVHWRSPWMRYFRDEFQDLIGHMGGPTSAFATAPRQGLARRAALLSTELCHIENAIGQMRNAPGGSDTDPDLLLLLDKYSTLTNTYARVLEKIGLDRAMRPTESLASYLEARRIEDAETVEVDEP